MQICNAVKGAFRIESENVLRIEKVVSGSHADEQCVENQRPLEFL